MLFNKGIFTISLDFELHWGCFEDMPLNSVQQEYFQNTRDVIPEMLQLFDVNQIHVTWAIVGMLYHRNVSEWKQASPSLLPTFENNRVSAYSWVNENGFCGDEDPCHFAPDLINQIGETPWQEIATHTYSHYFCLEKGQTKEQFKADLHFACEIAGKKGITIKSLVFPRNQFNHEYLSVCAEAGITSIRSSPDIWYWAPATGAGFMKRFFRAGDAYLKFQPIKPVFLKDIRTDQGLPLQLPATRLYRPWKPGQPLQNSLKMRRIINEMTMAAQQQSYYHLWWHPHNFGNNPVECMKELREIIRHFKRLESQYGFSSQSMNETTEILLAR